MGSADFCPLEGSLTSRSFWGPEQVVGRERESMLSLFHTSRLEEGGWGQSGNHLPLGLGWSVTTQDPSSTPVGLTQNLGHPPGKAVSPPTAWLQSDYSRSAKRLHPQGPASQASPPAPSPPAPLFLSPGPLAKQSTPVRPLVGRKQVPALPSPLPCFGAGCSFLPKASWPGLFETRSTPRRGARKYQGEAGQTMYKDGSPPQPV